MYGSEKMAKKTKNRNKKTIAQQLPENMLPQNILPIGERVEENKNIYISQAVYKEIHKFTKNKTTNESGGMLVGSVIEEFGKTNIIINGFVEAKYCEATPTTLKFTHETWEYVHKEIEKKHKGKKIVGWIHTHPDFGIFLSEYDKFIHQNFFNEEYQVAYVVDPIQSIEGFYFWINEKIEKCKGFYVYDKTGVNINVDVEKEEAIEKEETTIFNVKNILLAILSVVVVFLIFSNISTNNKLDEIEKQQKTLADSANQSLAYMQQLIFSQSGEISDLNKDVESLNTEIEDLKKVLIDVEDIVEPEDPSESDDTNNDNILPDEKTTDDSVKITNDEKTDVVTSEDAPNIDDENMSPPEASSDTTITDETSNGGSTSE